MKKLLVGLCVLVFSTSAYAGLVSVKVDSLTDRRNDPLNTGIVLEEGDWLTISCSVHDTWKLGSNKPQSRKCNADGLIDWPTSYDRPDLNFSAYYGTLVGQIGDGEWFLVGTKFHTDAVTDSGNLKLFCWDSEYRDNKGVITARVFTAPMFTTRMSAVPVSAVPAPGALLLAMVGLQSVTWWRRRL